MTTIGNCCVWLVLLHLPTYSLTHILTYPHTHPPIHPPTHTHTHTHTHTQVAVKIPSMQLSNSQVVINDLKREIETMAKLDHPNIVKLLGITESKHSTHD